MATVYRNVCLCALPACLLLLTAPTAAPQTILLHGEGTYEWRPGEIIRHGGVVRSHKGREYVQQTIYVPGPGGERVTATRAYTKHSGIAQIGPPEYRCVFAGGPPPEESGNERPSGQVLSWDLGLADGVADEIGYWQDARMIAEIAKEYEGPTTFIGAPSWCLGLMGEADLRSWGQKGDYSMRVERPVGRSWVPICKNVLSWDYTGGAYVMTAQVWDPTDTRRLYVPPAEQAWQESTYLAQHLACADVPLDVIGLTVDVRSVARSSERLMNANPQVERALRTAAGAHITKDGLSFAVLDMTATALPPPLKTLRTFRLLQRRAQYAEAMRVRTAPFATEALAKTVIRQVSTGRRTLANAAKLWSTSKTAKRSGGTEMSLSRGSSGLSKAAFSLTRDGEVGGPVKDGKRWTVVQRVSYVPAGDLPGWREAATKLRRRCEGLFGGVTEFEEETYVVQRER